MFSTTSLKTETGEIVNLLIKGEEIILTRYNRPFARIKPIKILKQDHLKNFLEY